MYRFVLVMLAGTLALARPNVQTAAAGPLDSRVTIDYRAAPAADVVRTLASAAGLQVEIAPGTLRPVTITLTNAITTRTPPGAGSQAASATGADRAGHVKLVNDWLIWSSHCRHRQCI